MSHPRYDPDTGMAVVDPISPRPKSIIPLGERTLIVQGDAQYKRLFALLDQAYVLLISAEPALLRAAEKLKPNTTPRELHELLHDEAVDWIDEYCTLMGKDFQDLARFEERE